MEEKSRGLSLRKKRSVRPKISAPMAATGPLPPGLEPPPKLMAASGGSSRSGSPQRKLESRDDTADYVKRRYSTRITQLPKDFNVPAMPALPPLMEARTPSPDKRKPTTAQAEPLVVDMKALEDPNLQADQCE